MPEEPKEGARHIGSLRPADGAPAGERREANPRRGASSLERRPPLPREEPPDEPPDDLPEVPSRVFANASGRALESGRSPVYKSQSPLSAGASELPPATDVALEAVAAAVSRLRAEVAATTDRTRKSRLLNEAAEIQERGEDEPGAARDYLAAYNADTSFREPLEGLLRLLERRRSTSNLAKLIDALVAAASTPEERTRALTQRAIFAEDAQHDLEAARGAARAATQTGAIAADLGPAWLALEMIAAKRESPTEREQALVQRAELTEDSTWRGLLLLDAATLAVARGDVERGLGLLGRARDEGGSAAFRACAGIERVVRAEPGAERPPEGTEEGTEGGADEARARTRLLAETLEARAAMIHDALRTPTRGDETGVPRHCRTVEDAVDALLRASATRLRMDDLDGAAHALDRALVVLDEATPPEDVDSTPEEQVARDALAVMERVVLAARLRIAETKGETALAAELASRRLLGENDGGIAASMSLRIAEHAASEGDVPRALEALTRATERDPASSPARALKVDILEGSGDAGRLAAELEELSRQFGSGDAQGRALLLAAYVSATRAENGARAREALRQAESCGVPKATVARLGRTLASVLSDQGWYEDATRTLVEAERSAMPSLPPGVPEREGSSALPLLWIELARLRLRKGDEAGAARATAELRELSAGAWLGRILEGLASPEIDRERARAALEELTAQVEDERLRRILSVVCALRARAAGDEAATIAHLETLATADATDPLVVAYLGDLFRLAGDRAAAARLASAAAEALDLARTDINAAAARYLEAAFEKWRLGDRSVALAHFEAAAELAPEAAQAAVAWAARGVDVDSLDGRRRALDSAGADAGVQLERFALEALLGDPEEAASALAAVDISSSPSLRLAGALARLAWPKAATEPEALIAALETLAAIGDEGKTAAAAERLRLTREDPETDAEGRSNAAKAWLDAGGGAAAAVEWLASAMATGAPRNEILPRRALAELASDEAREALHASATLLSWVLGPDEPHALVTGSSHAARLANLELSPPGCDPRQRAPALVDLNGALGEEAESDAMALAGWSALAAGDPSAALDVFRAVTTARQDDLHAWEGLRACAEEVGDDEAYAVACEQLGARCASATRGATFWDQAATAWLKLGGDFEARAESALDASFTRDPTRKQTFDRLFRRVRDRKDGDKLLALAARRLEVTEDPQEIAKLYWEQARVLREKGDPDAALSALEHVFKFEADHVGALALTGEIFIRRGMFEQAAQRLAQLARVEAAPPMNRVTAGVTAVDLYENKLGQHDNALEVLVGLHRARLTTLPVRERLARVAARTGAWAEATNILEELMNERAERQGRVEAARLALVIHRDRMRSPASAVKAATKLLDEVTSDGEALDLLITVDPSAPELRAYLERGRDAILAGLQEVPNDVQSHRRLARLAQALRDRTLEQAALSCAIALGGPDGSTEHRLATLSNQKSSVPRVALSESMLQKLVAPGDRGPMSDLFVALGPTITEALGPTRQALGVGRRERVDAKSGSALRTEVAQWAGAFGIEKFELYVGGKDDTAVRGIAGDTPALVIGVAVKSPLSPAMRGRVIRELFAIRCGTTVMKWRDDTTIAAIVVAACNLTKVRVEAPPYAVLAEVERQLGKAISRKTRAAIEPICRAHAGSGEDPQKWAARARASQSRAALLASGDVSVVLSDLYVEPVDRLSALVRDDARAHELFRFVLSRAYFDLRTALGLEGQG